MNKILLIVMSFIILSKTYAQILGFYPEVDTLFTAGGCTPTQIKAFSVPGQNGIDTLKILPDWNTWFWSSKYFSYTQVYFLISDSLKQDKTELWMNPLYENEKPILITPDSVIWFDAYEYYLKLILKKDNIVIDSLSQFCKARIGVGVKKETDIKGSRIQLSNIPNPFNQETLIKYEIIKNSNVQIIIYNIQGQQVEEIVNTYQSPGKYNSKWRTDRLRSGQYFIVLKTEDSVISSKCLLLK